jgi:TPR repeat protein
MIDYEFLERLIKLNPEVELKALDFENLLELATKGNPKAQYELGEMYYLSENLEQNYEEAFKWLNVF